MHCATLQGEKETGKKDGIEEKNIPNAEKNEISVYKLPDILNDAIVSKIWFDYFWIIVNAFIASYVIWCEVPVDWNTVGIRKDFLCICNHI